MPIPTAEELRADALTASIREARQEILRASDALNAADALLAAVEGTGGEPAAAATAYLEARRASLYAPAVALSTGHVLNLAGIVTAG